MFWPFSTAPKTGFYVSRLTLPETRSAFAMTVRNRHIAESAAAALWIQVLADLASGTFEVIPVLDPHYQLAEELLGRHGFRSRLRTLDALQLAVALEWSEHTPIDGLVLADQLYSVAGKTAALAADPDVWRRIRKSKRKTTRPG